MEGALCSSAAAEQITGQPAELGSSPPSPAADAGLPAWSLAALGELGAGWGTLQGCRGWLGHATAVASLCFIHCHVGI